MRIRHVTLAIGLLLVASSGGLLLLASIGIIAGFAEFSIPYPCGGIGGTFHSSCPLSLPLDISQVADFWAILGFVLIFASVGGLAGLLLGREFARPLILAIVSSVVFTSFLSWRNVLSVLLRYGYYSIPSIYIMLPFASLLIAVSSAVAITIWIIQSRVP
jgi:hypothetical protein